MMEIGLSEQQRITVYQPSNYKIMNTKTIKLLGTLELLVESLPYIGLIGHESGGDMYPFVWETLKQGKFNPFNLSISKRWLKLTDNDFIRTSSQAVECAKSFNSFSLKKDQEKQRLEKTISLFTLLDNNLQDLQTFEIQNYDYASAISLIVGKTIDGDWISVCPTSYTETDIPQKQISRTLQNQELNFEEIGENTKDLISDVEAITSEIGTIHLSGDLGGGYNYNYDNRIVYAVGKTKESAVEKVLQGSGILELSKFNGLYTDKLYFEEDYSSNKFEQRDSLFQKYSKFNQFLHQNFSDVMMYRFSFWTSENIYIIGQTKSSDWVGMHIESSFVYNP